MHVRRRLSGNRLKGGETPWLSRFDFDAGRSRRDETSPPAFCFFLFYIVVNPNEGKPGAECAAQTAPPRPFTRYRASVILFRQNTIYFIPSQHRKCLETVIEGLFKKKQTKKKTA